jgi:hypothetical protein
MSAVAVGGVSFAGDSPASGAIHSVGGGAAMRELPLRAPTPFD